MDYIYNYDFEIFLLEIRIEFILGENLGFMFDD